MDVAAVRRSPHVTEITTGVLGSRSSGPDILRGLAILLVMLVHLPIEATPSFLVGIRNYGWLGVDVFFVLSGYLIGTQLFKELMRTDTVNLRTFYLKRALRILPAYYVVLALYAFFPILRDTPTMQPLWRFATFTVNLGFDPRSGNAFSQAWTLSVEEHFYLILPLLALTLYLRITAAWTMLMAVALFAAGIMARYLLWEGEVGSLVEAGKLREAFPVYLRDIYYPTYTRLDGLVAGVALAAARTLKPDMYRKFLPATVTLPVGLAFTAIALVLFSIRGPLAGANLFPVFQAELGAVLGFPLISVGVALVLGGLLDCETVVKRWMIPGAATLATLSYSLYLTHKSVFHVDRLVFGADALQGIFGFAVYMATSFIAAAVLWIVVERTFLRLRDRLLHRG